MIPRKVHIFAVRDGRGTSFGRTAKRLKKQSIMENQVTLKLEAPLARLDVMSKEEVRQAVEAIENKLKGDMAETKAYAASRGLKVSFQYSSYFEKRMYEEFPVLLHTESISYKPVDYVINILQNWRDYAFIPVANLVESVHPKQRKVKFKNRKMQDRRGFLNMIGIRREDYTEKCFANGKMEIVFTTDEKFDQFSTLLEYRSEATEKMLGKITEKTIRKYFNKVLRNILFFYRNMTGEEINPSFLTKKDTGSMLEDTMRYANLLYQRNINYYLVRREAKKYVDKFISELGTRNSN